jgi:hypothetical protein
MSLCVYHSLLDESILYYCLHIKVYPILIFGVVLFLNNALSLPLSLLTPFER